ncbi:hypothetical protein D3C83_308540 [compost metagenome]
MRPVAVPPDDLESVLDALVEAVDRRDDAAAADLLRDAVAATGSSPAGDQPDAPFWRS